LEWRIAPTPEWLAFALSSDCFLSQPPQPTPEVWSEIKQLKYTAVSILTVICPDQESIQKLFKKRIALVLEVHKNQTSMLFLYLVVYKTWLLVLEFAAHVGTKADWLHLHRRLTCTFTNLSCGADNDSHRQPGTSTILWLASVLPSSLLGNKIVSWGARHIFKIDRSKVHLLQTAVPPATPAEQCRQTPPRTIHRVC
jgi:hypothetical protein